MSLTLLSRLLFPTSLFAFCTSVTVSKVQVLLAEAVNLIEAHRYGHHAAGQTYVRQHARLAPCSELKQLKQTRNSSEKMTSKNLVLKQLMRRGKYDSYQL